MSYYDAIHHPLRTTPIIITCIQQRGTVQYKRSPPRSLINNRQSLVVPLDSTVVVVVCPRKAFMMMMREQIVDDSIDQPMHRSVAPGVVRERSER